MLSDIKAGTRVSCSWMTSVFDHIRRHSFLHFPSSSEASRETISSKPTRLFSRCSRHLCPSIRGSWIGHAADLLEKGSHLHSSMTWCSIFIRSFLATSSRFAMEMPMAFPLVGMGHKFSLTRHRIMTPSAVARHRRVYDAAELSHK